MQKKNGISLIVLVITIIVMIILAIAVIITLNNASIIDKSNDAVTKQQQSEEKTRLLIVKNTVIAENYGKISVDKYVAALRNEGIIETGVTIDKYGNTVVKTKSGYELYIRQNGEEDLKISFEQITSDAGVGIVPGATEGTLAALITSADYGKTVDYSVMVDGETYDNWQLLYHNAEYVYLIAGEDVGGAILNKGTTVSSLTSAEEKLYEKFKVGSARNFELTDKIDGETAFGCQAVAQLIKDYSDFANTTASYASYVEGTIGGPTIELLIASWNAKDYYPEIALTTNEYGYLVNEEEALVGLKNDGVCLPEEYYYWVASPSGCYSDYVMLAGNGMFGCINYGGVNMMESFNNTFEDMNQIPYRVRPVVCLKASIPATVGTTTDFSLGK